MGRRLLIGLVVLAIAGCSWFQKNQPAVDAVLGLGATFGCETMPHPDQLAAAQAIMAIRATPANQLSFALQNPAPVIKGAAIFGALMSVASTYAASNAGSFGTYDAAFNASVLNICDRCEAGLKLAGVLVPK